MSMDVSDSVMPTKVPATVPATVPGRRGLLGGLAHVFGGWHFPVVAMTLLVGFAAMVVVVMVAPDGEEGFAAFAAEFKRWCFGWDGMSAVSTVQVLFMVSELLVFALVVRLIWAGPLAVAWRAERRAVLVTFGVGLGVLSFALTLLVKVGEPLGAQAAVSDLRTERQAPALVLEDHLGQRVDLAELRGKVVVVTAVYASCGNTCPMLLGQAKRMHKEVVAQRPALAQDLRILTITLDPAHDTREIRAQAAENQSVESPPWHVLGGAIEDVEAALDRWEVARRRNPETGQIDHANLFFVVDRQGRLAYRLGLSTEREAWLAEAVISLLDEGETP